MKHDWNQRRLRLTADLEETTTPDGSRLLKQTATATYLALPPEQMALLTAFDGQKTIQELLLSQLRQGKTRIRSFYNLVAEASEKGFLVATEGATTDTLGRLAGTVWPLSCRPGAAVVLGFALVVAGMIARVARPLRFPRTPGEWCLALLVLALTFSLSSILAGAALRGAGRLVYRVRLGWRCLVPFLAVDCRDAFMAGRRGELAVAALALAAPFLVLLLSAALGSTVGVFAGVVAAFVLVSPFGATPGHDLLYAVFRGEHQLPRRPTRFLGRKLLTHGLWRRQAFPEERYLLAYAAAALFWVGALLQTVAGFLDREGGALGSQLLYGRPPQQVQAFVILAALALLLAGPVLFQVWVVGSNGWHLVRPLLFPAESGRRWRRSAAARPSTAEIARFLSETLLFSQLSEADLTALAEGLTFTRVPAGRAIVRQGEKGESLFVLHSGRVVVERDDPLGHPQALATLGPGDVFGEIALLDHVPRTATVRATEAAELLVLSRANFERLVLSELSAEKVRRTIQISSFLRRCDLFAEWPDQAVVEVSIEFAFRGFEPGQTAVRQGEANKTFFLVYEGQFEVRVDGVHRRVMGPGDFFGEISLLAGGLATATVTALEPGRCLVLDREQFIGFVSQDSLTGYLIESVAESRQS